MIKIGETVERGDVTLTCEESDARCKGCYFFYPFGYCLAATIGIYQQFACRSCDRADAKNVIYRVKIGQTGEMK